MLKPAGAQGPEQPPEQGVQALTLAPALELALALALVERQQARPLARHKAAARVSEAIPVRDAVPSPVSTGAVTTWRR